MRARPETGNWTRRGLLSCGVAAAAMPGGALAQSIVADSGNPNTVQASSDIDMHLTIGAIINGKGPFRCVIDTGADRSVIADSVASELGLVRDTKVMVEGVVRTVPAETVHVDEISFGVIERKNLVLPVLPRQWLGADAYLGLDMIGDSRVTFDFKRRTLSVESPRPSSMFAFRMPNEDLVYAAGYKGHLRAVSCRVDGVATTVFIDTGAEVSAGNRALLDALVDRDPDRFIKSEEVQISGVTGGTAAGRIVDFGRIKVKDLTFSNGTIVIADLQVFHLWNLVDTPALLLGMNFLRQFNRVTIDYGRKEYRFEVATMFVAQRG
jgi:predicted aspartyl protease